MNQPTLNALQARSPDGKIHARTTKHSFTHVIFGKWEGRWCEYCWTREPRTAEMITQATRKGYADVVAVPVERQPAERH